MQDIRDYISNNKQRYEDELIDILKIPSISSSPDHLDDMTRMAEHLRNQMTTIGLEAAEVIPTSGHPIVYGEWLKATGKPTILIYGHYDVQPVDPIDLWNSPPFEPVIENNRIFARGSTDDKGQLYIHLKAVEAWLANRGELPVNVKFILEGEEEVGSENLGPFIAENLEKIQADYVVISDTQMFREGYPAITYGLRGMTYFQIDVRGTNTDLHSGSFGGVVANPINTLVNMLATIKDANGHITIPGFYDDVVEVSADEHQKLIRLPFDAEQFAAGIGAPKLCGEEGYTHLERLWTRPTFDINGIWGGFQGSGAKTVIAAEAHAKVSMRLVSDQDPETVSRLFQEYIRSVAPDSVEVTVHAMAGGHGYLADSDSPGLQAAVQALEEAFGNPVDTIREGGSIPIVYDFAKTLNAPVLLLGFGLPDQNAHAPNENFSLDNYHKGIQAIAGFFEKLAET